MWVYLQWSVNGELEVARCWRISLTNLRNLSESSGTPEFSNNAGLIRVEYGAKKNAREGNAEEYRFETIQVNIVNRIKKSNISSTSGLTNVIKISVKLLAKSVYNKSTISSHYW